VHLLVGRGGGGREGEGGEVGGVVRGKGPMEEGGGWEGGPLGCAGACGMYFGIYDFIVFCVSACVHVNLYL